MMISCLLGSSNDKKFCTQQKMYHPLFDDVIPYGAPIFHIISDYPPDITAFLRLYTDKVLSACFVDGLYHEIYSRADPLHEAALLAAEVLSIPVLDICIPNSLSAPVSFALFVAWRQTLLFLSQDGAEHVFDMVKDLFLAYFKVYIPNVSTKMFILIERFFDNRVRYIVFLLNAALTYKRKASTLSVHAPTPHCVYALPPLSEAAALEESAMRSKPEEPFIDIKTITQCRTALASEDTRSTKLRNITNKLKSDQEKERARGMAEQASMYAEDALSASLSNNIRHHHRVQNDEDHIAGVAANRLSKQYEILHAEVQNAQGSTRKK